MADIVQPERMYFLEMFEQTPDWVCIASKDGYFKDINPAVCHTLEYTREELLQQPIATHIHPDDLELTRSRRARLLEGESLLNFRNRYVSRSGNIVWLEWTSVYLPLREVVLAIAKNITSRREAESKIELEHEQTKLAASFLRSSAEDERRILAAQMHENIAQLASVLKMELDCVNALLPENDASSKRLLKAQSTAGLLIDSIRRTSFYASPSILYDHGFDAAVDWMCTDVASSRNIRCQYTGNGAIGLLPIDLQSDLFRLCQDALRIFSEIYHAAEITVQLQEAGNSWNMYIRCMPVCTLVDHSSCTALFQRAVLMQATCTIQQEENWLLLTVSWLAEQTTQPTQSPY